MKNKEHVMDEIAKSVKKNSYDWVLVLGTGISYDGMKAADDEFVKQIEQLRHEDEGQGSMRERVCRAVQKGDFSAAKTALYGDIWNGVSFLHDEEMEQKKRRERYAEKYAVREHINLEHYDRLDIRSLIKAFPGIILTTCPDEIIEAFLEDELCMVIRNNIYTPYSLATLMHWKKRLEKSRALIKLHGTCTQPCRLLLSKSDMDMYYPENDERLHTVEALDWIFQNKNLLFIGMDLKGDKEPLNRKPVLAPGIMRLLAKDIASWENKENEPLRYIILDEEERLDINNDIYEKLRIKKIFCDQSSVSTWISSLTQKIESAEAPLINESEHEKGGREEALVLTKEAAEEIFWDNYNRRPKHHISRREMHILQRHILEIPMPENSENMRQLKYYREDLERLAMAANNFAEFTDLWKAMDMAKARYGKDCQLDKGQIIDIVLNERIDNRSWELYQILEFYGQGFPMGFLTLIGEDEKELESWKRAGIQLTNSGIYDQSNDRKKIYEQMEYADQLVQYAGANPHKEMFMHRLRETGQQVVDSYFYPIKEKLNKIPDNDKLDVNGKYRVMLGRMIEILRDKSEGYSHLRSLLETEIRIIIKIVDKLEDYKEKPELLYYLLRECQILPEDTEKFLIKVEALREEITGEPDDEAALCKKLMLFQVQVIVMSCRQERDGKGDTGYNQREALKLCDNALGLIEKYEKRISGDKKGLMNVSVFKQQIELYLLKSKINGKLASIKEIERCHYTGEKDGKYENICMEQKKYLDDMSENLKRADMLRTNREKMTGDFYAALQAEIEHLLGEYHFKQSQFFNENIRYPYKESDLDTDREKEKNNYRDAEEHYDKALKFYQKYPEQYRLQEAAVLRNMADLFCRKGKSMNEIKNECSAKCYKYLEDAYMYYRGYNNLHGIADVLQSMGEMEDYEKKPEDGRRSGVCFYRASAKLYSDLGDEWSHYVVSAFLEGVREYLEREKTKS